MGETNNSQRASLEFVRHCQPLRDPLLVDLEDQQWDTCGISTFPSSFFVLMCLTDTSESRIAVLEVCCHTPLIDLVLEPLLCCLMLFGIDTRPATAEHCEPDKQCNDAGWQGKVIRKKSQTRTHVQTVKTCQYAFAIVAGLLSRLWSLSLQPRNAVTRTAREGTLEHWHHQRQRQQQKKQRQQHRQERSMGGNWEQTSKHCLTFTSLLNSTSSFCFTLTILSFIFTFSFTITLSPSLSLTPVFTHSSPTFTAFTFAFTLARPPVCSVGRMNTKVDFTVCITFTCPYHLMPFHQTISTSIRAVDDNQVCCS